MKFSNTVIITMLVVVVPLVCGKTVDFFTKCGGARVLISDYDQLTIKIDSSHWYGSVLTCEVIFQGLGGSTDSLYFDVTSYSNRNSVDFKVDGAITSPGIYAYWYPITSYFYKYYNKKTIYGYIRIAVTRRRASDNFNVQIKMNTSDYHFRYNSLPVGAILGIVAGVLIAIALAVAVIVYFCCCRHRMGRPGVVMATTTMQHPTQSPGYPMSFMQTTTVQGAAYPVQPGYPSQNQPMYPGYSAQPGANQLLPSADVLPPPYPGTADTK